MKIGLVAHVKKEAMISSVSTSALIEESPKFHNPHLVSLPKQAGRPGSGTSQKGFLATWLILYNY